MLLRRQPLPQLGGDDDQIALSGAGRAGPVEQPELVLPGAGQERLDQPRLAPEQEQQHTRTRPDRRGERPERQVRHAVLEGVAVSPLEELLTAGRCAGGHPA